LGDGIEDVGMVDGFDYHNLLKIGFLNIAYNNNFEFFKQQFDVVLEGDGDINYVTELLRSILS
jgi:hypothetical protein